MKTKEVIELKPGTVVYLIINAEIQTWTVMFFHPTHKNYFYFAGHGSSVETIKCLYVGENENHSSHSLRWEVDYNEAKKEMWRQLKNMVKSINHVYMDNKQSLNFEL